LICKSGAVNWWGRLSIVERMQESRNSQPLWGARELEWWKRSGRMFTMSAWETGLHSREILMLHMRWCLASWLIGVPESITVEQAAAGMNQGFLAYAFTHFAYPVKPGDWCLIQAAAGGIGLLLCQMAKIRGGRVIGVTSTREKSKFVKKAGADEVVISKESDIAKEARRITDGRGVAVVYDGVGKDTFEANLNSLAPGGYLVIYGQSSGYVPPFDLMTLQEKGSLFHHAHERAALPERISWISRAVRRLGEGRPAFHQN
jgi:NADPH:quinone reductase-like Zn-dependent oxidoreductase